MAISGEIPSLVPIYLRFKEVLSDIDIERLDEEWRSLSANGHDEIMDRFHSYETQMKMMNPIKKKKRKPAMIRNLENVPPASEILRERRHPFNSYADGDQLELGESEYDSVSGSSDSSEAESGSEMASYII